MMNMKDLAGSVAAIMEGKLSTHYYHGSDRPINSFSDDFVGNGNDEYGPGIYFANEPKTAMGYVNNESGGMLYVVELSFRKQLSKSEKINRTQVLKMMKASPDEYAVSNWSDNPNEAYRLALQNIMESYDNMLDAMLEVWASWYSNDSVQFVRNLVSLGYDGHLTELASGDIFATVYNPKAIKLVQSMSIEEAIAKFED